MVEIIKNCDMIRRSSIGSIGLPVNSAVSLRKGFFMERKPTVGIVSLYDETKESYWMLPGYVEGVEEAGGIPVILPLSQQGDALAHYAEAFDGFLFPGGHDLNPVFYGEERRETCGTLCPERDEMERRLFPLVLATKKPMLGICRGVQLFNVMLGGTLYQDIPTECPSDVEHHETPPYDKAAHTVCLAQDTPLFLAVGEEQIHVNSYHHQGIKALGKGLCEAAAAPDGLTEAVYLPEHPFCLAVQWHPEFSYKTDENSRKIFRAFVAACKNRF